MTIQREQLHTVQLVPITAFDADEKLNLEPMARLMARSYEAGIRVFLPCAGSARHVRAIITGDCSRHRS